MKLIKQSLNCAVIGLSLLAIDAQATTRNWTGYGLDANWLTATNWDTYPTPPAANGDTLVFTSQVQQSMTNNYGAITNTLTFANGGWTLYGNPIWVGGNITSSAGTNVINVNAAMTAARTITVSVDQLTMNGVLSGSFAMTKAGGGTLVLAGTNTYTGGTSIGNSAGIVRITNPKALGTGAVNLTKGGAVINGYLQLDIPGVNTIPNVITNIASTTFLGDLTVPLIENISGTNTITSSMVVSTGGGNGEAYKATGGLLILAGNLSGLSASRGIEFNGSGNGSVTGAITNATGNAAFPVTKDGTGTWTLNGTNTSTGAITISKGTLALGVTGSITTTPTITVNGVLDVSAVPGGWTMNNNMTMGGAGVVLGNVNVPTATISPNGGSAGMLTFSNNLALNGSTVSMNLSSDPTGTVQSNDLVNVIGNLTANGVNTISVGANPGSVLVNGTYTLIKFGGTFTGSAANFAVTNFPSGGRGTVSGYVTVGSGIISLVVTGTPPANLVWQGDGSANIWDVATTPNWLNGASPDVFYTNDAVLFNDASANTIVNLPGMVSPGYTAVNATKNYTITGAGAITGVNGLIKSGTGTLTLNVTNSYTGGTIIAGGAIAVPAIGNSATATPLGNGVLQLNGGILEYTGSGETATRSLSIGANGGTLQIDNPNATVTFSTSGGTIAGLNTFTKTGAGTAYWSLQQVLEGTNNIFGGVLKMPPATLGLFGANVATPIFINGGALDINGTSLSTKPAVVAGMGDLTLGATNGAIINSGASQTQGFQFVTLTGDTALGGTSRWDIRANSTASLSTGGNPYNLIKVGTNQISLVGVVVDPALANIDVRAGIFSYELGTTGLGNPANTLSVRNGAILDFWSANSLNKQIALYDGSFVTASTGTATVIGPVNLVGDTGGGTTFSVSNAVSLNLNGPVNGAGNLTKAGVGTLTLRGTNTYTGTTTVAGGKLVLNATQSGTGTITANSGTTFGVIAAGNNQLQPTSLTLGSNGNAVTNEFNAIGSTTTAPIHPANLTLNSPVRVNIVSGNFLSGQSYPLINYGSLSGSGSFILGSLPPLVVGTLSTSGNTLILNVSSAVALETWSGAVNNAWDINTTANWTFNGSAANFITGNPVQFDDTVVGPTTINIATAVQPGGVIFNNTAKNYTLTGGAITGTNNLSVLGSGTVTIYTTNSYTGGTVLSAGTLNINGNGAIGSGPLTINGGTVDDNSVGPVVYNNNIVQQWNGDFTYGGSQNLNFGTGPVTISTNRTVNFGGGTGTLTVGGISDNGSNYSLAVSGSGGTLAIGPSSYTAGTFVNGGTLIVQGDQTAAAGGLFVGTNNSAGGILTVAAGANILVNPNTSGVQIGSINPAASGTAANNMNVGGTVTNNAYLQIGRSAALTLSSNSVWMQNNAMQLIGISGYSARLSVNAGGAFFNNTTYPVYVSGGANGGLGVVNIEGLFVTPTAFTPNVTTTNTFSGQIVLTNGGTLQLSAPVTDITPPISSFPPLQFIVTNGSGVIDTAGNDSGISANITGNGGLTKAGAGTLTLISTEAYTGNTTVNGGTLAVQGSIAASTNIVVGGGTLDVSAVAFALANYQVLSNSTAGAAVNGSIDASVGTVALNYTAGMPAFSLTSGSLTLASTTGFKINNAGATLTNGSYKVVSSAGGSVVASGTLPAVTVGGNGTLNGATVSLGITNNELCLVVAGGSVVTNPTAPASITGIRLSGGDLIITGTNMNGGASFHYVVLATTNLATPLTNWTVLSTNSFNANGSFSYTNAVNPAQPAWFFSTKAVQ